MPLTMCREVPPCLDTTEVVENCVSGHVQHKQAAIFTNTPQSFGTTHQSQSPCLILQFVEPTVLAGDLYLAAMEATNPINPDALFMIKGADQSTLTTNGGQGFVTSETIISESGSSNPNAFFRTLLAKSYSTQACQQFDTPVASL